jgi:hypothetical protein
LPNLLLIFDQESPPALRHQNDAEHRYLFASVASLACDALLFLNIS